MLIRVLCCSVCCGSDTEGAWAGHRPVFQLRMEHIRLHSDATVRAGCDHYFPCALVRLRRGPAATSPAEIIQAEEALQRRVWNTGTPYSTHVFNCDRYASSLLLLRNHRHGALCRTTHEELLCVSMDIMTTGIKTQNKGKESENSN